MSELISRRVLLKRALQTAAGLATASVLAPILLSACDKKNNASSINLAKEQEQIVPCENQENLSDDDKARRRNLKYVDQSPISTRTCDNCKLYINKSAGSDCGGCRILPGPIHPKGYCSSWYARM